MASLINVIKLQSSFGRGEFLGWVILATIIYALFIIFFQDYFFSELEWVSQLILGSLRDLIYATLIFLFAAARCNDICISKFVAASLFLPWLFGFDNLFLIGHYFYRTDRINELMTYVSISAVVSMYLVIFYLAVKNGRNKPKLGSDHNIC
jgi:hypothetical protein